MPPTPLILGPNNFSAAVAAHSPVLVLYVAALAVSGIPPAPLSGAAELLRGQRGAVALCADAGLAAETGVIVLPALRVHHHHTGAGGPLAFAYAGTPTASALAAFVTRHARDAPVVAGDAAALAREVNESTDGGALVLFAAPDAASGTPATALAALRSLASDTALRRTAFVVAPASLHAERCPPPVDTSASGCEPTTPDDVFMVDMTDAARKDVPVSSGVRLAVAAEAPLLLVRRGEVLAYEGPREAEALRVWLLDRASSPLLAEVSASSYERYRYAAGCTGEGTGACPKPMFWLLLNASRPGCLALEVGHRARVVQLVRRVAAATRGAALFGWLDAERHAHHVPVALRLPALVADRGESHYVFPAPLDRIPTAVDADHSPQVRQGEAGSGDGAASSAVVDASGRVTPAEGLVAAGSKGAAGGVAAVAGALPSAEAYHNALYAPVLRWVRGVIDGTVPPTLRSEEPPLDNLAPVVRLVGSTVEPLALHSRADVLLLVHAPWGGERTAALLQEADAVARLWAHERRLRVASIDVSRNDVPRSLGVTATPALLFLRADRPEGAPPIDISAVSSRDELLGAVVQHSSFGIARPVDPEELARLAAMLPRLGREAGRLLDENERLGAEVAALRARLAAAEESSRPAG